MVSLQARLGGLNIRHASTLAVLLLLLPSLLPLDVVQLADGAGEVGRVKLNPPGGGMRFAADGSIVRAQSFFVDSLCGDDLADGRTAKTAFATVDAAVTKFRAAPSTETTVFLRVGQAHRMLPRDPDDPLAIWPVDAIQPWQPELDEKEKLDSRGCPFNEEILIGISSAPDSTAVRPCASSASSPLNTPP